MKLGANPFKNGGVIYISLFAIKAGTDKADITHRTGSTAKNMYT